MAKDIKDTKEAAALLAARGLVVRVMLDEHSSRNAHCDRQRMPAGEAWISVDHHAVNWCVSIAGLFEVKAEYGWERGPDLLAATQTQIDRAVKYRILPSWAKPKPGELRKALRKLARVIR